jgi:hypothetical protein
MPYIHELKRQYLTHLDETYLTDPGELNYAITVLMRNYWNGSDKTYQAINDILGALEGAKLEFYRRVVVPYEDEKIRLNGDVY